MSRKIFNRDNMTQNKIVQSLGAKADLYENSISACGCLFYRIQNNKFQLLLISYSDPNWPKLDDFGGKIDNDDTSVFEAIARETSEETNDIISKEFMMELLPTINKTFYNKQSKYFVAVSEVDNSFHNNTSTFGSFESTDKINRTVHWFNYEDIKPKLSLRLLANLDLIKYLDALNDNASKKVLEII